MQTRRRYIFWSSRRYSKTPDALIITRTCIKRYPLKRFLRSISSMAAAADSVARFAGVNSDHQTIA